MSNLIITIIGIALTAITALIGIVVLSPAIDNYNVKVASVRLMDGVQQLRSAIKVYEADHGGSHQMFGTCVSSAGAYGTNFVPQYLTAMPSIPAQVASDPVNFSNLVLYAADSMNSPAVAVGPNCENSNKPILMVGIPIPGLWTSNVFSDKVCTQFAGLTQGNINHANDGANQISGATPTTLLDGRSVNCFVYNGGYEAITALISP